MTGICSFCGKECSVRVVDNGIGNYEFWGSKECQTILDVESSCCGDDVIDTDGSIVSHTDFKQYEESKRDYYSDGR